MTTTPSSTSFRRGQVLLVAIRFTDDTEVKQRPAVIVSSDAFNADRADIVVMPLTTSAAPPRVGDHVIADWQAASLPRPSTAKATVVTIAKRTVRRTFGRLSDGDMRSIDGQLRVTFGL
jgi:mRNA interferase MazF